MMTKVIDGQIEAKVGSQPSVFIDERHGLLTMHGQPARFKLEGERLFVHGLKQPRRKSGGRP
jgi:hypothetical protein